VLVNIVIKCYKILFLILKLTFSYLCTCVWYDFVV